MSERDKFLTEAEQHTLRDRFLTESLGECWHEWRIVPQSESWDEYTTNVEAEFSCQICAEVISHPIKDSYGSVLKIPLPQSIDFSTWEGFGKLWEWSQKQEWFNEFRNELLLIHLQETFAWINPDRFADAVYTYLKEG